MLGWTYVARGEALLVLPIEQAQDALGAGEPVSPLRTRLAPAAICQTVARRPR